MISQVFVNIAILLSFIFVVGQVFRDRTLHDPLSLQGKLVVGVITGLFGIVLMRYSLEVETYILDLRHLAIIIAAITGGPVSTMFASILISVIRLTLFHTATFISQIAAVSILGVGVGCSIIVTIVSSWKKRWIWLMLFCMVMGCITLAPMTSNIPIYIMYCASFLLTGYITYLSITYVNQSNEIYRYMEK